MKKESKKKEKETPIKCDCGKDAFLVKFKSKYMYSCADVTRCSARSLWYSTEQEAVKNWNTIIQERKHERRCKQCLTQEKS